MALYLRERLTRKSASPAPCGGTLSTAWRGELSLLHAVEKVARSAG